MVTELTQKRLAVIREIVELKKDSGKTSIQKIVYFLQESVGLELHYPFRMYHYGPYSNELDGDLSLSQALGYIDIKPDPEGFGYHVTPFDSAPVSWPNEISISSNDIKQTIKTLGSLSVSSLELYATVHFVSKLNPALPRDEILATVKTLKPKFPEYVIKSAYENLRNISLIS